MSKKWTAREAEAALAEEAVRQEFYSYFDSDQPEVHPETDTMVAFAVEEDIGGNLAYDRGEWFNDMLTERLDADDSGKVKLEKKISFELEDDEYLGLVHVAGQVAAGGIGYGGSPGVAKKYLPSGVIVVAKGEEENEVELDLTWAQEEDPEFYAAIQKAHGSMYPVGDHAYEMVSIHWTAYVDPDEAIEDYGDEEE